jgi:hypothetical protein
MYKYKNKLIDLKTAIEIAEINTLQIDYLLQYIFSQNITLYYIKKLDKSLFKVN